MTNTDPKKGTPLSQAKPDDVIGDYIKENSSPVPEVKPAAASIPAPASIDAANAPIPSPKPADHNIPASKPTGFDDIGKLINDAEADKRPPHLPPNNASATNPPPAPEQNIIDTSGGSCRSSGIVTHYAIQFRILDAESKPCEPEEANTAPKEYDAINYPPETRTRSKHPEALAPYKGMRYTIYAPGDTSLCGGKPLWGETGSGGLTAPFYTFRPGAEVYLYIGHLPLERFYRSMRDRIPRSQTDIAVRAWDLPSVKKDEVKELQYDAALCDIYMGKASINNEPDAVASAFNEAPLAHGKTEAVNDKGKIVCREARTKRLWKPWTPSPKLLHYTRGAEGFTDRFRHLNEDGSDVYTVGYGHAVRKYNPKGSTHINPEYKYFWNLYGLDNINAKKMTEKEAMDLLRKDVAERTNLKGLHRGVSAAHYKDTDPHHREKPDYYNNYHEIQVPLYPHELDALLDVNYNSGSGVWKTGGFRNLNNHTEKVNGRSIAELLNEGDYIGPADIMPARTNSVPYKGDRSKAGAPQSERSGGVANRRVKSQLIFKYAEYVHVSPFIDGKPHIIPLTQKQKEEGLLNEKQTDGVK